MSIAYQVVGSGDVDIVLVPSFVSHLDLLWTVPECANWLEQVSSFAKLVIFDKLGTGLSDPVPSVRTIDDRVREIEAVISHSGVENPALFGMSEGAPSAIMYAATHPTRVRSLVLFGAFGRFGMPSIFERNADVSPATRVAEAEAIRASMLEDGWIEDHVPTTDQIERLLRWQEAAFAHWGEGRCLRELLPSAPSPTSALATFERSSASPGMARATLSAVLAIDITAVLPTISVPTLVIHARDDLVPVQFGRYVAEKIPDARYVELDSADHAPWIGEPEAVLEQLELFLTGTHHRPPPTRVLATVLFTDIVRSTEIAHRLGDTRWRHLLEQFDRRVREVTTRHEGQLVKAMGDGHLTTYSAPTNALRAATELHGGVAELGIELRAGAHTGEVEVIGDDIGGLAVHIAARIGAAADAGEILVSRTVRDLVIGSGTRFENRGPHVLKGVPEPWELMAVVDDDPGGPANPEVLLAQAATPPARTSMTRTDRIIGRVASRAPWLVRSGISRLG